MHSSGFSKKVNEFFPAAGKFAQHNHLRGQDGGAKSKNNGRCGIRGSANASEDDDEDLEAAGCDPGGGGGDTKCAELGSPAKLLKNEEER